MRGCSPPLALAVPLLAAGSAEARRGVKPYYSESYQTRGPVRGYEGYVAPDYYCSYKRFPNRECTTDRRRQAALPRHELAPRADLPVSGETNLPLQTAPAC